MRRDRAEVGLLEDEKRSAGRVNDREKVEGGR